MNHKIGPNGTTTLIERGKSGESHPGGGAASRAEPSDNPQSCEGDQQSLGGIMIPNSLLGFQSRSPVFRTLSRSSSGYFSFDSDSIPSSPLLKDNKSTQTPSPSSQVITHALQRMSRALETRRDYDVWPNPLRPYRASPPPTAADMRPEILIGQELQRIGDEFNNLFIHGRLAGRNGQVAQGNLQQMHQEPAFLLWMGLLIGRLLQIILRRR
ncbi:bcl-2-like protein 11 isoform X2 [Oncorhynchus tshawytscha]|uniref:bcl-2-like protein 11 isoform X2 n=1 Tax=Oncorhynchus tshawytscha TaxID=74940 RepID=UPI000D0982CA|nr:bcl-2-like protein 11 isoform X2 [Oncorhynchus tshawytscha]